MTKFNINGFSRLFSACLIFALLCLGLQNWTYELFLFVTGKKRAVGEMATIGGPLAAPFALIAVFIYLRNSAGAKKVTHLLGVIAALVFCVSLRELHSQLVFSLR